MIWKKKNIKWNLGVGNVEKMAKKHIIESFISM